MAYCKKLLPFSALLCWLLMSAALFEHVYTDTNPENNSLSAANSASWSDPVPIPINLDDQYPVTPNIVSKNDELVLGFQGNNITLQNEMSLISDVYSMRYRNDMWSTPVMISESAVPSFNPRFALNARNGDQTIHAVWGAQTTDEARLEGPPRPGAPDELFYAYNKNGIWSEPVSLFRSNWRTLQFSSRLVVDYSENLHLLFLARDPENENWPTIFYIRNEQESWTPPKPVATMGGDPDLASMKDDRLFFTYIRSDTTWAREHRSRGNNSVFIKTSSDGGETWKESLVHRSGANPAYRPRIVVDEKNRVHVLWMQDTTADRRPDSIFHTWSDDHGTTWHDPAPLVDGSIGFPLFYTVQETPAGNVYVVFVAGEEPGRFASHLYFTSWKGGKWTSPEQLFDFPSTGQPALAYDADKRQLHMVFRAGPVDRAQPHLQRLYHAVYME